MTNEEFLRDVCPNHTDKSQWNKSELLHILGLHKEQLRLHIVNQQSELLKEIFDLTAGAWDDPVISEDLYNRMEAAISFNCG